MQNLEQKLKNKIQELENKIKDIKEENIKWWDRQWEYEKQGDFEMYDTIERILSCNYKEISRLEQIKDVLSSILREDD